MRKGLGKLVGTFARIRYGDSVALRERIARK